MFVAILSVVLWVIDIEHLVEVVYFVRQQSGGRAPGIEDMFPVVQPPRYPTLT